jgi:transposase InsO family protein
VNVHKNARLAPEGRAQLVKRVLFEKESVQEVGRGMRVSPATVRKWVKRYQAQGVAGLVDRSSRPRRSPKRLAQKLVRRIERLRRRGWTGQRIAEALMLAVSTVGLWLRRLGLERLSRLQPKPVVVRYERRRPGELLHLDTKKLGCIGRIGHRIHGDRHKRAHRVGWEYLHVCIDDATRVVYAEMAAEEGERAVSDFVQRAVAWFRDQGVWVERVMTDNGSGYRSHHFRKTLEAIGARHLFTRPYRPQTNGKAERFIQTALREWAYAAAYRNSWARSAALPGFLNRYNRRRPHRSLANQSPLSRLESLLVNNNVLVADT